MPDFATALPEKCADCAAITYPSHGFCRECLSEAVDELSLPVSGKLLATTVLRHSFEPSITPHLPLILCSVELTDGPVVFALTKDEGLEAGAEVSMNIGHWSFGELLTVTGE